MKQKDQKLLAAARTGDLEAIVTALFTFGPAKSKSHAPEIAREIWNSLKSMSRDNPDALAALAQLNIYGHIYGRYEAKGVAQMLRAAELGSLEAQYHKGIYKFYGMYGIKKDLIEALSLFSDLSDKKHNDSSYWYQVCLQELKIENPHGVEFFIVFNNKNIKKSKENIVGIFLSRKIAESVSNNIISNLEFDGSINNLEVHSFKLDHIYSQGRLVLNLIENGNV